MSGGRVVRWGSIGAVRRVIVETFNEVIVVVIVGRCFVVSDNKAL